MITPGTQADRFEAAQTSGADVALVDLEDSVAPSDKQTARDTAPRFFARLNAPCTRGLRINSPTTLDGVTDLAAIAAYPRKPEVILVPKVESARDIEIVAGVLDTDDHTPHIWALIETPRAIDTLSSIMAAPRLDGVVFGSADYAAAAGCRLGWESLLYVRSALVNSATAVGLPAIDAPVYDLHDLDELRREAELAKQLGFYGSGEHLATRMIAERLRPLRERGAVISAISTASNGYARRLGWEAPVHVFAWSVTTDDLKRSFTKGDEFEIEHGFTENVRDLQRELARHWNGPVLRPDWWSPWKETKNALTTYRFNKPEHPTSGLLSLAMKRRDRHGMRLAVHDFWAAEESTAKAMLAFLGRHNTRADTIEFRRGVLPPYPTLLHNLHRYRMAAEAWHPWMLRILDIPAAIRLRGWPADLDASIPIEIESDNGGSWDRYLLQITAESAEINPTSAEGEVRFTRRQLAVWYAGGYRTVTSARMAGVRAASDKALTTLILCTAELEPWLPDHF